MNLAEQPTRRPAGRRLALLVLVLLAGILGMHALAPAPAAAQHAAAGHAHASGHGPAMAGSGEGCSHTAGGSGHVDHADATCAATGVSSAYAPPALAAAPVTADTVASTAGVTADGALSGRAPPDLAELQLLRI
ncbi:DUF6153 family protein [Streptomyces bambusae]|uniref:DUF1328 domain-containing protein n=1 Tax=Streptomyces bambusae TaxID=1550616 RepID=A0ABS6Z1E6_9ACTN|nr:DUF6153 family protein [Streptomyces bambusae]MBW5480575.1 hypothetical protein [Streptomyces bambusae]